MAPPAPFRPNYGITFVTQCDPATEDCVYNASLDFVVTGSFEQLFGTTDDFWKNANLLASLEAGFGKNLETGPALGANFDYVGFYPEYLRRFESGIGYTNDNLDLKIGVFNPMRYLYPSATSGDEVNRFLGTSAVRPPAWNWPTSLTVPIIGAKYAFNPYFDLSGIVGLDAFAEDKAFMAGTRVAGHWEPGSDYEGTFAGVVNYRMGTSVDEESGNYTPQGGTALGLQLEQKFTKYAQLAFMFGYLFHVQDASDQVSFSSQLASQLWEKSDLGMNLIAGFAHTYYVDDGSSAKTNTEELYLRFLMFDHYALTANVQWEQGGEKDIVIPGLRVTVYW